MGWIRDRVATYVLGSAAARSYTLQEYDPVLAEALGGTGLQAGVAVTRDTSMQFSAFWACVRVIAESIASLPIHVYERDDNNGRRRVYGNALGTLIADEPNSLMTGFTFREVLSVGTLTQGNGYAYILRTQGADVLELFPVQNVRVSRAPTLGLVYDFMLGDRTVRAGQADMLHVPGLSFDGVLGLSVVRYAAQALGIGLAAEKYGATFFGNGSTPAGVIELAGKLTRQQADALRASWQRTYGGVSNANKTAVLYHGAKFSRISIPNDEAQFIETRKFQVSDIARWFRVPPHMIGDLERATFSNIEHQSLDFVMHTLRPWLVRIEQEFNRKLFPSGTDGKPNSMWCEFAVDGLLRGDVKSRSDYYVKGRQWGWLSSNDVRRLENMPPIEGGDEYLTPLNMVAVGDGTDPVAEGSGDSKTKE